MDAHFLRAVSLKPDAPREGYPFDIPSIAGLGALDLAHDVVCFVGDNGSGKSTMIEAIAVASGLNAEGGSRHIRYATRESHSCLADHINLVRGIRRPRDSYFFRAESYYTLSTQIEALGVLDYYGDRSLHECSHGEGFLRLVAERFGGGGLYLMDEPESALSTVGQLALLRAVDRLAKSGAQLIIATHSPILTAYPNACIYEFGDAPPKRVAYEETDNYVLMRRFLTDPRHMLEALL